MSWKINLIPISSRSKVRPLTVVKTTQISCLLMDRFELQVRTRKHHTLSEFETQDNFIIAGNPKQRIAGNPGTHTVQQAGRGTAQCGNSGKLRLLIHTQCNEGSRHSWPKLAQA